MIAGCRFKERPYVKSSIIFIAGQQGLRRSGCSILAPSLARGNTLSREVSIRPKGTSPIAPVADDFAGLG